MLRKTLWIVCLLLLRGVCAAQSFSCPSPNIYLLTNAILVYNTSLPVSATNPSNTGIPLLTGSNGLTLMPNINGGTLTPTFYTTVSGVYYYWSGSAWVSTNHSTGNAAAVNLGGCGSTIYNFVGGNATVYSYNGTGNGSQLVTLSNESGSTFDIVPDCNCNFYIFNGSHHTLNKYSPTGALLTTYSLTNVNTAGGAGYAIVGNNVYYGSGGVYVGSMATGTTITFTLIPGSTAISGSDWASCPVDINVVPVTETISVGASQCQTASIVASTTTSVLYSWSGPGITGASTGSAIAVNAAGVYSCTVMSSGCGALPSLTLNASLGTNTCITVASTSITCASLGSATVSVPGSSSVFTYTWLPGNQTGSVVSGLSPGTYTLIVFDTGNNSSYTTTTVFTSSVPLTGNLVNTASLSCYGASDGTAAVINISGGSGSQTYVWSDGVHTYTGSSPSSLSAGLWSVTVTDALTGCAINQQFLISQPPAVSVTTSSSFTSACVNTSVVLTGTASGGTSSSGYTYSWTAGPAADTYSVTQGSGGTYVYTLTATDDNACSASSTLALVFFNYPVVSVSSVSVCPQQTGTLTASGAASYTWNTGATGSTFTDSPLSTQEYTVTGETSGCSTAATASIILKPVPAAVLSSNSPVCQGSALLLSASGGTSYAWSGPNSFASAVAGNTIQPVQPAAGGNYSVIVTAANSCTALAKDTVVIKPLPLLAITPNTPSICVNTNSVTLNSNGTATSFTWQPNQGVSSASSPTITAYPLSTQIYTLLAGLNGCTTAATATVYVVPPPSPNVSLSSPTTCAQLFNGSPNTITLTAAGATSYTISTPNHIYNSNPGGPASSLSTQPPHLPGVETATLYGGNGACTISITAIFTVVPNPTVTINSYTPEICAGESFTYTNAGASSYTWSSATPGQTLYTTGSAAIVSPGVSSMFSVFGGSLGCNSALQTSTITVKPLPSVAVSPSPAVMCLNQPLLLTANGTGVTFTWSPPAWLNNTQSAIVSANPPVQQSYTVVAALNSCTNSAAVTVSVLPLPSPVITVVSQSICANDSIILHGSGGVSYTWAGPGNLSALGQTLHFKANSAYYSGIYTLTVLDYNNCPGTATQSITVHNLPSGNLLSRNTQGCVPLRSELVFEASPLSAPVVSMQWQLNQHTYTGPSFGDYFTTAGNYLVTGSFSDINACVGTMTTEINVYPLPVAGFSYSPANPVENFDEVQFIATTPDAVRFNWNIGDQVRNSAKQDPVLLFDAAGAYPVALEVNNQWGCKDTVVKIVTIAPDFAVYIPNTFTPNDDDRNDLFRPVMRGVKSFTFYIFDRWGHLLFKTSEFGAGWDGNYRGKLCEQDAYAWKLELTVQAESTRGNGKEQIRTGQVLLYR